MEQGQPAETTDLRSERLDKWLHYGFHVLVMVLPLIISYRITNDQFDLIKLAFLRITLIFLFLCFGARFFLGEQIRIKRTCIDYLVLIFLALIALSTVFSVHHPTSVFGKYKRYQGLLTYINYGMLFFLAAQFFKRPDQIKSIARSMVIAAGLVSAYGVLQYFGWDFLSWALPFESGRSFSTFGNPVLLGGYLAIILPLSLGLFFSTDGLGQRFFWGMMILAIFSCLIATFSRGAWLAAVVSVAIFFSLSWRWLKWKKRIVLLSCCFLLIAVSLFAFSWLYPTESRVDIGERLTSGFILHGSSLTRIEIWKSSVEMIKARPVLGFGPDCFRLVFRKYQTLKYKRMVGESTVADNAHNYFLQLASMIGLPATIVFIAIVTAFFFSMKKFLLSFKGRNEYFLFTGLILAVLGYCIYLLFGISITGSTSLLWLILGMMMGLSSKSEISLNWRIRLNSRRFIFSGTLLISLILIVLSLFPFLADFHFAKANDLAEIGYYDRSVIQYNRAVSYYPYLDNYYYELGALNLRWANATEEQKYFNRAVEAMETAKKVNPLETDNYFLLTSVYAFGAKRFDSCYYNKAIYQLRKTIKLEPYSSYAYYLLGTIHIDRGLFPEAVMNFKKALAIDPGFEDTNFYLAFTYEQLGQDNAALRYYRKTLSLNSENWAAKEAIKRLRPKKETHR